jgi:hypothetical protein
MPRPDPSDGLNFVPDFQKRTTGKGEDAGFSWKTNMSKRARAMLRAGDTLVIAGGDVKGGFLKTLSARRGAALGEQPLGASPVWDGLAVAGGRLYAALENGTVVCLGGRPVNAAASGGVRPSRPWVIADKMGDLDHVARE